MKNITYKAGNLSTVGDEIRNKLSRLTLGDKGTMYGLVNRETPSSPIVVAYKDEEPVGWIAIMESLSAFIRGEKKWVAYVGVYVKEDKRLQGIGKELINQFGEVLKPNFDFLAFSPHDNPSSVFFSKIGTEKWLEYPYDRFDDFFGRRIKKIKERMLTTETDRKVDMGAFIRNYVIGIINDGGEVLGSNTAFDHKILLTWIPSYYGFSLSNKRWRMDKDDNIVRWWDSPTQIEKDLVRDFLKNKYDIIVRGNTTFQMKIKEEDDEENQIRWPINRNITTEIKKMITEGIKEKALEDFIKTTIQGTEWQGKVFIAGGYVRDEFMGKDPKDLDLLVNSPNGGIEFAKWITKQVGSYKGGPDETPGSNPVIFPRFGTAKFNLRGVIHNGIDLSDMDIESVMPRKEQYTAGSRKPVVTGGELKDDVERRDFTVNSLLKDLSTGEILDLTGMGKADIQAGIIRTPLNPDKIFTDDPLRMLRAVRFAVKYNWKLPMFMMRGLKKNASQLQNISQERIRDELNKMLVTSSPDKAVKLLKITGLLQFVIPELIPAIKMTQNVHHKHDVFHHTLDVLKKTEPVLIQRLMGLFHDIGKTLTRTVNPDTKGVHFYGHEEVGEKIVGDVMTRLKYPNELIDAVKLGVRNHMILKQAGNAGVKINDKTLLKFRNEMGDQLENMLNVMHADNIAHSDASSMPNQITAIRNRLNNLKTIPTKPKLPINGNDLIQLGIKPGPVFTDILKKITDAWYENPALSKEDALNIVKGLTSNDKTI